MAKIPKDWRTKEIVLHNPDVLEPGENIRIRGFYSDDARQRCLSASVEQYRNEHGETVTRATLDRLRATKRELAVIGWTLVDAEGQPLPFDRETLLYALPSDLADWLDAEIDAAWGGLGAPLASKEEAERLEKEAKEDRSTFRGDRAAVTQGRETDRRPNDGTREGPAGASLKGAPPPQALDNVRH